ncbi:related to L-lactate dehydrogenase [Phialocephala subalpina]|uniref:Related to L-lactate dehydrogenase n=1 Tax=Phialocephala subalpina TaxID=576137 RepID=A0A1L7WCZ7_9HELO|nr:related to L-lactate dehydrogenase [Phialocephala subalpina]
MDANRLAFRQWKLVPRMLRPTTHRDLTIELFGEKYENPILMAPIGVQYNPFSTRTQKQGSQKSVQKLASHIELETGLDSPDPVFGKNFKENFNAEPEDKITEASAEWIGDVFSGAVHSWGKIALLKKHWDGPIVLKGIRRQLDGAVGSLDMLPEIVEAVGNKLTVIFDSGIRTGVDIIKALSLGAKAVFVGKPAIYGLAVAGKQGAKQVLQGILADVDQSM